MIQVGTCRINSEAINATDFREKLDAFFGGVVADIQTKNENSFSYFYNKRFGLLKVTRIDRRLLSTYRKHHPGLLSDSCYEHVAMESFSATLDGNFKVVPKPITDEWSGVSWTDLVTNAKKTLKI